MIEISFNSDEPLYLQIADYFRRLIAGGKLKAGDRLPAIRGLAKSLGIDPGTVSRAYQELEREGTITGRRGGGSFVSSTAREEYLTRRHQEKLGSLMERSILEALGLGFSIEEIESVFILKLANWRERRIHSDTQLKNNKIRNSHDVIFSGSHDLAVELLASHVSTLYPDIRFVTSFTGSMLGLISLVRREADIAGAHLLDEETGEFNIPFIKRIMPGESVVLVNLVQRIQGLMISPGNPKHITGIDDLKLPDVTFINRQRGSGTRILLDSQLLKHGILPHEVRGYTREETTHVAVAAAIAQGEADVGLGAESAAIAARLDFVPLIKERYDLIVLQETLVKGQMQKVLAVIQDKSFKKLLEPLSGYDLSETGNIINVDSKSR